jgi:nitrogen fixation NifU-like protein
MATKSPYDDLVMDHIRNARNYRSPDDADRQAHGSNPLCGDEVTVYLRMNGGRLDDAAFQCSCCGISMASASMMTESVTGRSAAEARSRARSMIELLKARADPAAREGDEMTSALLATVREFPARAGCALLPWITLEAALDDRPEATLAP